MASLNQLNPYEAPQTIQSLVNEPFASQPIRSFNPLFLFLVGAVIGGISFVVSLMLVPVSVANLTEHDLRLANHLGFIFPVLIGVWTGYVRRSIARGVLGVICGVVIGVFYYMLCESRDFLAIMVGFPTLLGGFTSILLGRNYSPIFLSAMLRFFKGIAAGFVLGLCYMVILNSSPMSFNSVASYHQSMWSAGLIAMTFASGLYLMLFHWSANLYPSKSTQPE